MDYKTRPISREDLRSIAKFMREVFKCKHSFLRGYEAMMSKIEPSTVICFGTPFKEMTGNIVAVDYVSSRKKVR